MSTIAFIFILLSIVFILGLYYNKKNTLIENNKYLNVIDSLKTTNMKLDSLYREYLSKYNKSTKIIIPNEFKNKVFFASGSSVIQSQFYIILNEYANSIKDSLFSEKYNFVQVEGHTDIDRITNRDYADNWDLGAARAIAVVRFLEKKGIPSSCLSATSHSKFKPAVIGQSNKAKAKNRRIEIVLLKK